MRARNKYIPVFRSVISVVLLLLKFSKTSFNSHYIFSRANKEKTRTFNSWITLVVLELTKLNIIILENFDSGKLMKYSCFLSARSNNVMTCQLSRRYFALKFFTNIYKFYQFQGKIRICGASSLLLVIVIILNMSLTDLNL